MNTKRLTALILIYLLAGVGWVILGVVTSGRSEEFSDRLAPRVKANWGEILIQSAPLFSVADSDQNDPRWIMPDANTIKVGLKRDYRRKGLVWYPTYICAFDGTYTICNREETAQRIRLHFDFPSKEGTYDKFGMYIDNRKLESPVNTQEGISQVIEIEPAGERTFQVTYETRGMGEWRYRFNGRIGRVQNLNLSALTDFGAVDYPESALSPMSVVRTADGAAVTWNAADLITRQDIGLIIPEKLNPGPLSSRITFFAPVCLIFFFVLIITIGLVSRINIHPMHYLFVSAGFFAFHLLLAYLVDHFDIHISFILSALVSLFLVNLYLSAALGREFPWKIATAGQFFFLVLFSYSFFLKGMTGLTVTIGAIITLAVIMKVTARMDWEKVFAPAPRPSRVKAEQD